MMISTLLNYVAILPCEILKFKITSKHLPERLICFAQELAKLDKVQNMHATEYHRNDLHELNFSVQNTNGIATFRMDFNSELVC